MKRQITKHLFFISLLILVLSTSAQGQDLKSILSGIIQEVAGDVTTNEFSVAGNWNYTSPACKFEGDNLLASAGSEVVSSQVEDKMATVYNKLGLESLQITLNGDKSFTCNAGKLKSNGTYTFDPATRTISFKNKLGISVNAEVIVVGNNMTLLFKADKLLEALKLFTGYISSKSSAAKSIASMAEKYKGLSLGFEFGKVQ